MLMFQIILGQRGFCLYEKYLHINSFVRMTLLVEFGSSESALIDDVTLVHDWILDVVDFVSGDGFYVAAKDCTSRVKFCL